jgi:hypothetical protein
MLRANEIATPLFKRSPAVVYDESGRRFRWRAFLFDFENVGAEVNTFVADEDAGARR